jgi:hypothetical protein
MCPIRNGLKQGDTLLPLLLNFASEYTIRRVQLHHDGLKLNSSHMILVNAYDVYILAGSIHNKQKKTKVLVVASKETALQVNADKSKYMIMS